ncbi:MAG TPA: GNAT family N-acetyltransferase [Chloroflexota bacterium]|nr:GNAT family N-acetyltransferase [Chloroflexota bacterium]
MTGFIRVAHKPNAPAPTAIETLFVDDRHRHQDVATALIDQACDWARARGCPDISVDFIAPNTIARDLYEYLGFVPFLATHVLRL